MCTRKARECSTFKIAWKLIMIAILAGQSLGDMFNAKQQPTNCNFSLCGFVCLVRFLSFLCLPYILTGCIYVHANSYEKSDACTNDKTTYKKKVKAYVSSRQKAYVSCAQKKKKKAYVSHQQSNNKILKTVFCFSIVVK